LDIFKYFESKDNNSAQAIIIYIFNLYAKIFKNSEKNILLLDRDCQILRNIINKFSHMLNDQEIISIICFITTIVEQYPPKISEYIYQSRVIESFNLIPNFANSLNIIEYSDGERSVSHIIFCWVIYFLRQSLIRYELDLQKVNYYEVVLNFLLQHESRIFKLLENTEFSDSNGNTIPKSLAYLEELEYISGLLSNLWPNFKFWKRNPKFVDFYNKVNYLIINKTLLLFDPKKQKEQYFHIHSLAEKNMRDITTLMEIDTKIINKEHSGIFSPSKRLKDYNEDKSNSYSLHNSNYNSWNTNNIYWLKVEITLNRVLMNITDCLKYGRVYDNYNNNTFYINNMKDIYKQKPENFNIHCNNLLDALQFANNSLDTLVKNNNLKALYEKCMIYYHNTISSFNFCFLNLVYLGKYCYIFICFYVIYLFTCFAYIMLFNFRSI